MEFNKEARRRAMEEYFTEEERSIISFALTTYANIQEEKANDVKDSKLPAGKKLYHQRMDNTIKAFDLSWYF